MTDSPRRPVILLAKRAPADLPARIAAGERPRADYLELARAIGAEILDLRSVESSRLPWVREVGECLGPISGLAWLGYLRRREFDGIYATGEDIGMPLGLLLRVARQREALTVLVHNAGTPKRRRFLRLLGHGVYRNVLCLGSAQRRILTEEIGLPEAKVRRLDYSCDQRFFRSDSEVTGEYVLSVGVESRDYATLEAVARSLDYPFRVVASGWSSGEGFSAASSLASRSNMTVGRGYSYLELRQLYAGARFLVVPLKNVSSAAGIQSIVEGMAMGKAIVASASAGILDYVKDGVSSRLVPVGDAAALRRGVVELWEHPERAAAIGRHNRAWIERSMTIDRYVARIAELMGSESAPDG